MATNISLANLGTALPYGDGLAILLETACLNTGLARGIVALGSTVDNSRLVANSYLGITSGLPVILPR
jgi:hypothetical protein